MHGNLGAEGGLQNFQGATASKPSCWHYPWWGNYEGEMYMTVVKKEGSRHWKSERVEKGKWINAPGCSSIKWVKCDCSLTYNLNITTL